MVEEIKEKIMDEPQEEESETIEDLETKFGDTKEIILQNSTNTFSERIEGAK